MKLSIVARSGREIVKGGVDLSDEATVDDLQAAIHKAVPKLYPSRQRLTTPGSSPTDKPIVLQSGKRLECYFEKGGGQVTLKDLGPQVGYQTVFFWEYFGPLVVYPLFYVFQEALYPGTPASRKAVQLHATIFWCAHYAKRIFETFFVHRFSHATMPIFNLFKNCSYYWGFAAAVSYFVNHPLYTQVSESQQLVGFVIGTLAELGNLYCHIILTNLRSDGSKAYKMPKGFLFNYITCANYTMEILAWVGFNIATQSLMGYLFLAAGAYQMTMWAIQKHKRLIKLFNGKDGTAKYPRRWIILPPFL